MQLLSNERRFILAVVAGELMISNRKKADIEAQLQHDGYDRMPPSKKVSLLKALPLEINQVDVIRTLPAYPVHL